MGKELDIPQGQRFLRWVNSNRWDVLVVTHIFLVIGFLRNAVQIVLQPFDRVVQTVHNEILLLEFIDFVLKESFENLRPVRF